MLLKSFLVGALVTVLSINIQAQKLEPKGLVESVELIQQQKSASPSLSFQLNGKIYNIKSIDISRLENNKLILKSDSELKLNLVKNETGFHGTFIDETTASAYLIRQNSNGTVFFKEHDIDKMTYVCNFDSDDNLKKETKKKTRGYIGNYNTNSDVYKLESRPGARFCILVDFDGNNGGPYSGHGNHLPTVAGVSDAYAKIVWEQMADDFSQFDVNVTTNESLYNTYARSNKVLCAYARFTSGGWKGIAAVGSFGSGSTALVNIDINPNVDDAADDARTGSHEVGHTLGLDHDGGGGDPYYSGHGEYVPIMGSGDRPVSHWSIGEYQSANNNEDDISIMASTLTMIPDDIPNSVNLDMTANGFVDASRNNGIIGSRSDIDKFKFITTHGGEVNIQASPGILRSNIDIKLTLTDANGNAIISDNPTRKRSASIKTELPNGGTYYIEIDGDGELGVNDGWSDYSSQGYYELSGFIGGNVTITNDVEFLSLEGLGDNCGPTITPVVELKNKGSQTITSVDATVYVDGNLARQETIAVSIPSGSTKKYDLTALTAGGSHNVEVEVSLTNGLDQLEFNNNKSSSYKLSSGKAVRFTTDYIDFTGQDPFSWKITSNGSEIANSQNFPTQEISTGKISQTACVTPKCYDVQISSEYNTCESYPAYSGGSYSKGDIVVIDGIMYEAKWWNTDHPSTGATWNTLGKCVGDAATIKLYNPNSNDVHVDITAGDVNGNYEEEFCVSNITSTNEIVDQNVRLFPNPTNGILNIVSNQTIDAIKIYSSQGQLVFHSTSNLTSESLNLSNLKAGFYLIKVHGEGSTTSENIVIK